jgi:hypothetical protein
MYITSDFISDEDGLSDFTFITSVELLIKKNYYESQFMAETV